MPYLGASEIELANFSLLHSYLPMDRQGFSVEEGSGYGGIVNMGLTCYANAVIQCMRHIPRVAWILEKGKFDTLFDSSPTLKAKRRMQQTTTTAFGEVVQMLWQCKKGQSVRPADFWRTVSPLVEDTLYEHFAMKAPHDAHEFFLFLLETIHESTAQEVEMRIVRPPPTTPQEHLVLQALQSWQREFSKEYSPFVDLFFGLTHWKTCCQECKNISHRWESFNSLKVSIPPTSSDHPPTLLEMLETEMEPETVEGYQCDKCPQRTTAKRFARIWRLPQTLVIVIKRFTPDGRKVYTRIAPLQGSGEEMDLAPFFSEESPERKGDTTFHLRGIVDHHGGSNGGHYTAQARHCGDSKWYFYDDEGVNEMTTGSQMGDTTYMLFLERTATTVAPEA